MEERKIFTYEEALATFPRVQQLTAAAVREVEALVNDVQGREEMDSRRHELEAAYQAIVQKWAEEILAIGCEIKGVWLVDWDSGDGYYCWRYPEETLGHYHSYEDGFRGRIPIA